MFSVFLLGPSTLAVPVDGAAVPVMRRCGRAPVGVKEPKQLHPRAHAGLAVADVRPNGARAVPVPMVMPVFLETVSHGPSLVYNSNSSDVYAFLRKERHVFHAFCPGRC